MLIVRCSRFSFSFMLSSAFRCFCGNQRYIATDLPISTVLCLCFVLCSPEFTWTLVQKVREFLCSLPVRLSVTLKAFFFFYNEQWQPQLLNVHSEWKSQKVFTWSQWQWDFLCCVDMGSDSFSSLLVLPSGCVVNLYQRFYWTKLSVCQGFTFCHWIPTHHHWGFPLQVVNAVLTKSRFLNE